MVGKASSFEEFERELAALVARFSKDEREYTGPDYSKARLRDDFLNPLIPALGDSRRPPNWRRWVIPKPPSVNGSAFAGPSATRKGFGIRLLGGYGSTFGRFPVIHLLCS
jgi:hypothetical protein